MIWLVYLISMRSSETVVLIKYYRPDVHLFCAIAAILLRKRLRQGYWEMVECGDCMLW